MPNQSQVEQILKGAGFIAALDQSGGSTPKALRLYGIDEGAYASEDEMYDLIHAMRSRIAEAPEFSGDKVIGAILFEKTMDREMGGKPSGTYLWEDSRVVPFLKVDKGLADAADGVQLMKPIDGLDALLKRAVAAEMFGTKMRSVIGEASKSGIAANVAQQFEIGKQILAAGLVPIIEPEITISMDNKAEAEAMLLDAIGAELDALKPGEDVMLKLTLPETANQYKALVDHDRVMRVVALSGGYDRAEANARLAKNAGVVASFSRALTEGLSASQDDATFRAQLADTIDSIYRASISG
ncbi:fructose bisphosphate aldolase [uncultured Litoreibacter sp.]|uniref:fructose bisphosphate aldolase n=1 Tax=uncultured Litoreibacter sp. TaxID=1392394 RepID=UPI002632BCE3|nr:fructose bisphosphate aldolase [uncultured Litoreibacter sp.]